MVREAKTNPSRPNHHSQLTLGLQWPLARTMTVMLSTRPTQVFLSCEPSLYCLDCFDPGIDNTFIQLSFIESTIYCPIIVLVKISILLQYNTVFVTHQKTAFHHSVHVLIWTNIAYYTISTLLCIFEVSYYTSRSLDVTYESPEKLTTHTVLRNKHCGIRTSLDTASVSNSLESLLISSMSVSDFSIFV